MNNTPEFLTVDELAELLRIKPRKVYDLAAAGKVPCTRATGKLLFPEAELRAWIAAQSAGPASRNAVFLGSHDPLLDWALRQSRCGLATFFDGSADGLNRFATGEGIATGSHIYDDASEGWNIATVQQKCADTDAVLIAWATRTRGLVFPKTKTFKSMEDIAGSNVAVRSPQSGTALFFDRLVAETGVKPRKLVGPYHSEQDAVLAVSGGEADVTFGLEAVARQFDLGFTQVMDERFDILIDRAAYFEEPMQTFLAFCHSDAFANRAKSLGGYCLADHGKVRWNA